MQCKLCLEEKPLIKAHIVPEAFARILREYSGDKPPLLVGSGPEYIFPRRQPVGIYDANILCLPCEQKFGDWDAYAAELLIQGLENTQVYDMGGPLFFGPKYDYAKLKLFFISLLWRAAASTRREYANISLGPFEAVAREAILNAEPGDPQFFGTFLTSRLLKKACFLA